MALMRKLRKSRHAQRQNHARWKTIARIPASESLTINTTTTRLKQRGFLFMHAGNYRVERGGFGGEGDQV